MDNFNEIAYLLNYLGMKSDKKVNRKNSKEFDIDRDESISIVNKACGMIAKLLLIEIREINSIKNELEFLYKRKNDIADLSLNKRKEIINLCIGKNRDSVNNLLDQYNTTVFLKTTIKILEEDKQYKSKIDSCRKCFKNEEMTNLIKYLYDNGKTSSIALFNENIDKVKFDTINNIKFIKKESNKDNIYYSLTPTGKNLYAFYVNENKNIIDSPNEASENLLNDVLEYLIDYADSVNSNKTYKKTASLPKFKSKRTQYNINKLKSIIATKDKYKLGVPMADYKSEYTYNRRRF